MKNNYFKSPVIASSGLLGFFGEGYKYHFFLRMIFPFFGYIIKKYMTFQSKTTTAFKRIGNLRLENDGYTVADFYPNCIRANLFKGVGINNVSLSGPGIFALLAENKWQKMKGEIHLSVMLVGNTKAERLKEAETIASVLKSELKNFQAYKIFLHWNVSCPNTGHDAMKEFLENFEVENKILKNIGLPLFIKVAWNFPIELAVAIQKRGMADGFDAINTIPFDDLPEETKKKYFLQTIWNYISPLDKYNKFYNVKGRGGVSGNPIRRYALGWIINARNAGVTLPIIGGGGILNLRHVYQFKKVGATAVSPGSVIFLRPWNLIFIILYARLIFKKH